MNNLIIFSFIFIVLIPGIYLALRNDFLIIKNKKYNHFFIRAIYTIPLPTLFVLFFSSAVVFIFRFLLVETTNTIVNTFGEAVVLVIPIFFAILCIWFVHATYLRNDVPPEYWPDFEKYELYVYMPDIKMDENITYKTKFHTPAPKKNSKKLQKLIQIGELVIDYKYLKGKDITYGLNGEIVVNEKALELFKNNNLTGFQEQPVRNLKNSKVKTEEKYFQLIPTHTMPPVSAETKIVEYFTNHSIFMSSTVYINDRIVRYNKSVLPVSDFNVSLEVFGDENRVLYAPQNLWLVSNKVMRIMINDLDQRKRDFIPVILVEDGVTSK